MYVDNPRAGVLRRLSAMMYDGLVLCALWMGAMALGLLVVVLLDKAGVISLVGYQDAADYIQQHAIWFQLYTLAVFAWFFLYFWTKAGQTLGMRAWRMLVISADGAPLSFKQSCIRLATSLLGLGNFWLWLQRGQGLALQDKAAGTIVVVLTKEQSQEFNLHKTAR